MAGLGGVGVHHPLLSGGCLQGRQCIFKFSDGERDSWDGVGWDRGEGGHGGVVQT